jgi:hypothetical protein
LVIGELKLAAQYTAFVANYCQLQWTPVFMWMKITKYHINALGKVSLIHTLVPEAGIEAETASVSAVIFTARYWQPSAVIIGPSAAGGWQ